MSFRKPVPDLGPCEGRWVSAFGVPRECSNRACESFDSPCGHTHRLCPTCVFALERGMGTWDETGDVVRFGMPATGAPTSGTEREGFRASPWTGSMAAARVGKRRAVRRHAERVPLHVALAGICACAALVAVSLRSPAVTGPVAVGTAVLIYSLMLRYTWHR